MHCYCQRFFICQQQTSKPNGHTFRGSNSVVVLFPPEKGFTQQGKMLQVSKFIQYSRQQERYDKNYMKHNQSSRDGYQGIIFVFLHEIICGGDSLEAPRRGIRKTSRFKKKWKFFRQKMNILYKNWDIFYISAKT